MNLACLIFLVEVAVTPTPTPTLIPTTPVPTPRVVAGPRPLGSVPLKYSRTEVERRLGSSSGTATGQKPIGKSERASAPSPSPTAEQSDSYKGHLDGDGRGELYWRKRAESLRHETNEADRDLKRIEKELLGDPRMGPISIGDGSSGAPSYGELDRLMRERDAARQRVEKLGKDRVALEQEARRANAYPGWLR